MDTSSRVNLRSNANRGWEEFSIVRDCDQGLDAGLRTYEDTTCDLMVNNSNAIVANHDLIIDNSNAINRLNDCCVQVSDQVYANSEAIVNTWELTVENSEAIVYWADISFNNSLAIVANSLDLIFQNSVAINANRAAIDSNSNAIVANREAINNNSDAIIELQEDLDTVLAYSIRLDHIETLTQFIVDNSNAINSLSDCCVQISEQVYANSEAIDYWADRIVENSDAIKALESGTSMQDWVEETSDAVHYYGPIIVGNSNAINRLSDCCEQISEQVYANSDAIDYWADRIVENSNAINGLSDCCVQISEQVYANSEAIVYWADRILENSDAIEAVYQLALFNSLAIVANSLDLIFQNSLAIEANRLAIVNNSNAIVANRIAITNNSGAIIELQEDLDLVLAYSVRLDNLESLTGLIISNSIEIEELQECCVQISDQVYANSEAIIALVGQVGAVNQTDINNFYNFFGSFDHGPGDIYFDSNQTMSYNIYLGPERKMNLQESMILDGGSWYIHFSRADEPLLLIDAGKTVTLQNVVLKDFSPDYVSFGDADSKLIFGPNTTLELAENITLATEWTFTGDCTIKGFDKKISLDTGGRLDVYDSSILRLEDVELCGVGATPDNLRCRTNDGSIVLQDCKLGIASNYSFSYGSMLFKQDVKITGTNIFEYATSMASTIDVCSTLFIDFGMTFKYAPPIPNRDLLIMTNTSSRLHLNGCMLHSTPTGLRLTNGMVFFDNFVTLSADGQVSSESISFGNIEDSVGTNDVIVGVLGGAHVEAYGYIDMK